MLFQIGGNVNADASRMGVMINDSTASPWPSRWRLALLMFLLYGPPGALLPMFSLYLSRLGFTPVEIGWCCATQALAGLVTPLVLGQAADRWWPAECCLAACAAGEGVLLWVLSGLTEPLPVFLTSLAVWMAMGPSLSLGAAVTFRHLAVPERDYGPIRMFGTAGWVVTCWALAYWFTEPAWLAGVRDLLRPKGAGAELADLLRLGSALAFVLAAYSLTLPHSPPQRLATTWLAPAAAFRLFRQRSFAVYCLVYVGFAMTIAFTSQVTPLLLDGYGVSRQALPLVLTIAQATEIASLAVLPQLLSRLGVRGTMLLGLGAWLATLLILTVGTPFALVIASMAGNGLAISGFLVAGQVFVNGRAHGDIRASAQALLQLCAGVGMLAGNLLVGGVRHAVDGAFTPTYAVGASLALALVIGFALGFREEGPEHLAEEQAALEPATR